MIDIASFNVFDCHFHIIDQRFPLVANNGYLPEFFPCSEYRNRTSQYTMCGGAIVSGSFQAFDQTYLIAALETLGANYIGVTQLPETTADDEIIRLNKAGIKGVRFNLRRGGSEGIEKLESFAHRIHRLAGWHIELYIDSRELNPLVDTLIQLPAVSIGHLGLSKEGFPTLLKLVEHGICVKATGFGRVDFNVKTALQEICAVDSRCLMFGTDLPSTRVEKPYSHEDFLLVLEALGEDLARKVFYENAMEFYGLQRK